MCGLCEGREGLHGAPGWHDLKAGGLGTLRRVLLASETYGNV